MKKYVGKLGLLVLVLVLLFWPAIAQSAHSINLTWGASSTTGVLYIVSRGTVSGGPYTVLSSTVSGLTYNDTAGVGGTTYYYVVQATCTGGTCPTGVSGTSANSNQASATFLSGPAAPAGLGAVAQ
jgi:hypothetical protein